MIGFCSDGLSLIIDIGKIDDAIEGCVVDLPSGFFCIISCCNADDVVR